MQKVDPEKALYLLLEGTDCLEGLCGDCRTQDHSRNFDIEQLAQKFGVPHHSFHNAAITQT